MDECLLTKAILKHCCVVRALHVNLEFTRPSLKTGYSKWRLSFEITHCYPEGGVRDFRTRLADSALWKSYAKLLTCIWGTYMYMDMQHLLDVKEIAS